jgi:tetratricopeptide (TPR) repeat protein
MTTTADLARMEPLPVRVQRGPVATDGFDETYHQALDRYRAREFKSAEALLAQAAALNPDHPEVHLYLGSARLLLGRLEDAMPVLHRAVEVARTPVQLEESKWQLANAYLAADQGDMATAVLREVVKLDDNRREKAEELLQLLDGR